MKKNRLPPKAEKKKPTSDGTVKEAHFPIVGIGASAGGLEALEQFLCHVPPEPGMAFVIIQHLDPTHQGIMPELLQRITALKVVQVKDRTRVEKDVVYVIPPNTDMSLLHGYLHLLLPTAPRGLRLPIDHFFRSLADDQRERAIAVLLSGMGTDGTMGFRAIKENAGVTLVQDPSTARFDGMPRSAIDAGLADLIAPAEELPARIIAYIRNTGVIRRELPGGDKTHGALEKVVLLLRTRTGNDFSLYKKSTVYRRIERRMGIHQIDKIAGYVRYVQENPSELDLLFKELLIGVTSFFRDPPVWEYIKKDIVPPLLAAHRQGETLRAWVAGCSTGEEAYSLSVVLREAMDHVKGNILFQIFATDLDRDAIERARQGYFPVNIAADVTAERLKRFFIKDDSGYRVSKIIRETVIFAPQNLVVDPPFTRLDMLVCRNLLIYLTPEAQQKLLPFFHYSLKPGGILVLGNAETVGTSGDLFTALDPKYRVFRRVDAPAPLGLLELPRTFKAVPFRQDNEVPQRLMQSADIQTVADRFLLARYAPAAVMTTRDGDIIYISGRTGKYLEPPAGRANWNIFAMAREGLKYEMTNTFQKALKQKGPIVSRGVRVGTNGGEQSVDLTVEVIREHENLREMVIFVFSDVPTLPGAKPVRRPSKNTETLELERQLQQMRDELQSSREEMQTSQEELKSANEELQSTNEELQSTNEELTTSKEEMQSMNEELQTVNAELQVKVDELSRANNDMKNLLNSTNIATIFLDGDLNVRRFTPEATAIINLIPSDIGRPVTDITSTMSYPELRNDVEKVLETLVFLEKEIVMTDGKWFAMRIMPYRTIENMIDGVVITFVNITRTKDLEAELRKTLTTLTAVKAGEIL